MGKRDIHNHSYASLHTPNCKNSSTNMTYLMKAGSLEIITEENFLQRKHGIESCKDCIKERNKDKKTRKRKKRDVQVKVNSPIVVRLSDTIKVSVKGKLKQSPKSSDIESTCSTDSEDNILLTSDNQKENLCPNNIPFVKSQDLRTKAIKGNMRLKAEKNLKSFLSAFEKEKSETVGTKQSNSYKSNLLKETDFHNKYEGQSFDSSHSSLLNNFRDYHYGNHNSSYLPHNQRGIKFFDLNKNCKFVQNDLRGKGLVEKQDSLEDSESGSVTSTEYHSDIESGSSSSSIESTEELSHREISHLSSYAYGAPFTKYDCPPHECPECLSAYHTYRHYYRYQNDSIEVIDRKKRMMKVQQDKLSDRGEDREILYHVTITGKDTATVSLANFNADNKHEPSGESRQDITSNTYKPNHIYISSNKHKKKNYSFQSRKLRYSSYSDKPGVWTSAYNTYPTYSTSTEYSAYCDSISVDLTNSSDVTFTVEYHSQEKHSSQYSFNNSDIFPFYSTMVGFFPYALPYYMTPPYYYMCPLMMSIPRPLVVPRDLPCLASQRLCLIPASDIKQFTASAPPQRPWLPIANPDTTRPVAIYTVMCYNVLCDKYCTRQLYGYCPSWALNWEYRKKAIIEDIRQYNADIISLQEVETEQFYQYFLPELERDGYKGIFSPKSRAKTMSELEKKHVDGCAIFFRATKFSLIKEHLIEFNKLAMSNAEGSHDMINRVMTKDNIGLAALLETKEAIWENGLPTTGAKMPILVATCHIHWDPEYSDVKLIQTMMLMSELKNIVEESGTSLRPGSSAPDTNSVPLLLCGDLNSLPDSGVVEYLTAGKVSANHIDFRGLGYNDCLSKLNIADNNDLFTHGFRLMQAYEKDIMPYTNYTYDFKGIIDYIFFSKDFMRPLGVLGPLDFEWFRDHKVIGCPHPHIPSDHLPLLVEVEMNPTPSGRAPQALNRR